MNTSQRPTRRERRVLASVEDSPLAWEVRRLVRDYAPSVTVLNTVTVVTFRDGHSQTHRERHCWTSSATVLLNGLNERASPANRNAEEWPQTPQQLGRELNKLKEGLALKNVLVTYRRHGRYGRLWALIAVDTPTG